MYATRRGAAGKIMEIRVFLIEKNNIFRLNSLDTICKLNNPIHLTLIATDAMLPAMKISSS